MPCWIFACCLFSASAQRLSPLAPPPRWQDLDVFQDTITRAEFVRLLDSVYAPGGEARGLIVVGADAAIVQTSLHPPAEWRLHFAPDAGDSRPPPRYWRPAAALGPAAAERPLAGLRIALDPGHLGGEWAQMEGRWFQVGESLPVVEGEMTLQVAERLAPELRDLGAEVIFVRDHAGPATAERPETLAAAAREELALQHSDHPPAADEPAKDDDPSRDNPVRWTSELLFFRTAEIRARAQLVNEQIKPDLVLCLHFNGEGWGGDPRNPIFVPRNHLHVLVNGSYAVDELHFDDQRHDLLRKLLNRSFAEELAVSERVATALAALTKLPPYQYPTPNARLTGTTPYVWTRNLLANRLYEAPVVFLEPYVMNSEEVWARVQAGDYEGERLVAGAWRKNLYREYADAVATGLAEYYRAVRPAAP